MAHRRENRIVARRGELAEAVHRCKSSCQEHVDIKFITMIFGALIMAAATQGE